MLALFTQMTKGVLAVLGEDSLLRGTVECKVNIEHGVLVTGLDDNVVCERSVATIAIEHVPKVGDTLTHPDGSYKLDTLYADTGTSRRFILIKS